MSTELMTTTRLKTGRACKRLHHVEYDLGYRPAIDAQELRFGDLLHRGMEAWWRAYKAGLSEDALLDAALAALGVEADAYDRAKAVAMLTGYHYRWKDEQYEVLFIEERFETQLINPETGAASRTWRLGGKVDVIVRDLRDGLTKLLEHKTSSEDITPGSEYWRRLRMDSQVSIYFDGSVALGTPVQEAVYDVLFKPTQKPSQVPVLDDDGVKIVLDANGERVRTKDGKKWRESASSADGYVLQTRLETPEEYQARILDAIAEAPEKYFQRGQVVRLEAELDEHRFDVWQTAKEIREGQVAERYPRNPDACTRYGRTCWLFDVCTGADTLTNAARYRKSQHIHPELALGQTAERPKEEVA